MPLDEREHLTPRLHQDADVLGKLRHPESRQAVLSGSEDLPLAAQRQVDLGELEAVALGRDRLEAPMGQLRSGSANRMQWEACRPRPTRPRS